MLQVGLEASLSRRPSKVCKNAYMRVWGIQGHATSQDCLRSNSSMSDSPVRVRLEDPCPSGFI